MIICSTPCYAKSNYMTATRKLAHAYYKYSDLDDQVKQLERRHVPKRVREQAVVIGCLVSLVLERKASFRWEFP